MSSLDAFGRLRTCQPFTTFNYYPSNLSANSTNDRDIWNSYGDGGTITYNSNNYINMPTLGSGTTYSLRQTKQPMAYQSGKSQYIFITGVPMATVDTNTSAYMGLFNTSNNDTSPVITLGMYFYTNGTNLYFGETITGGSSSTVVQSSWNIDTFDGSGPSGLTLTISDVAKCMLIIFDRQWLGIGIIRCGFIINGVPYYAHAFYHNGYTVQYTTTPRLHITYWITGTAANSMRQMCCTNNVEGGYITTGKLNSIGIPIASAVDVSSTNNNIILALRVNPDYNYDAGTIIPIKLNMYFTASTGNYLFYQMQVITSAVGTITGTPPSYTSLTDSIVQYYIGTGDALYVSSPGYVLTSGYCEGKSTENIITNEAEINLSRLTIATGDILVITAIGNVASATAVAAITFIEEI